IYQNIHFVGRETLWRNMATGGSRFSTLAIMREGRMQQLKITGSRTCSEPLPPKGYMPSLRFITTIFARKFVTNSCKLTVSSYGLILFKVDGTGLFSIPCSVRWQPQGFLSAHIPTSY